MARNLDFEAGVDPRDMQRAYPAPTCGDHRCTVPEHRLPVVVSFGEACVVDLGPPVELGTTAGVTFGVVNQDDRKFDQCPTCGTQYERGDSELPAWLQDPGLPDAIKNADHVDALKADAKRLADLRDERNNLWPTDTSDSNVNVVFLKERERMLDGLIAVYEECQARGRLFGGLR